MAIEVKLTKIIAKKLKRFWSPQQIADWLKRRYPDDERDHMPHEAIYRTLYIQTRGALKKELLACLRSKRVIRRSKHSSQKAGQGKIVDAVTISERPSSVEDRAIPGHWEGDLIAVEVFVSLFTPFVIIITECCVDPLNSQPITVSQQTCTSVRFVEITPSSAAIYALSSV